MKKISYFQYYSTYHGHEIEHLQLTKNVLTELNPKSSFIYLAGDSSLDSKYWFRETATACNGYENILEPPKMKQDICYHLNDLLEGSGQIVINSAIEESTLGERKSKLRAQDEFIRDNITGDDTLIVSVGGNDIALRPSASTVFNMLLLQATNSAESMKRGPSSCWGMNHFVWLFRDQLRAYLLKLFEKNKPKKCIVTMIYFPDEQQSGGWADRVLGWLGYYSNPAKLQEAIRQIYKHAISDIHIDGVQVLPHAWFSTLDGKDSSLYVAGVEPSAKGCAVMARSVLPLLIDSDDANRSPALVGEKRRRVKVRKQRQ